MGSDNPEQLILQTLARALSGPDQAAAAILVPDEAWSPRPRRVTSGVAIWGRPAETDGRSILRSGLSAVRREIRLLLLSHPRARAGVPSRIYRLPPRAFGAGAKALLRRRLLEGAVVEFRETSAGPRLISEIADEAKAELSLDTLVLGAGGAVLARAQLKGGPALLRCGLVGSANDPAASASALRLLQGRGERRVPTPYQLGITRGLSWSLESFLPGARPSELTVKLVEQVAGMLVRLPQSASPSSVNEDFAYLAHVVPAHAATIERWEGHLTGQLTDLPGVFLHGDLWLGNVLAESTGDLSGVVDWDAWRPDGAPGVDLLHLVATDIRLSNGLSLGEVYLRRPWTTQLYTTGSASYWNRLGVTPSTSLLEAVGAAWWVTQAAGDLRRNSLLAHDGDWISRNIANVMRSVRR